MPRPASISLEEYRRLAGLPSIEQIEKQDALSEKPKLNKFGAKRTWYESPMVGGRWYQSGHEAKEAAKLDYAVHAGWVRYWLPQVTIPLKGRTETRQRTMRVDFMVVYDTGQVRWVDAKGFVTPEWSLKRDLVREQYGIEIETV